MNHVRQMGIAGLMALGVLCVGCASSGTGAKSVVSSMVDTRVEVVKAQADVDKTLLTLEALEQPGGDLTAKFKEFKAAVASTNAQKNRAVQRADSMRLDSAEYQKRWEQETSEINSPELRSSAEERRAHVHAKYEQIRDLAADSRQLYASFYTDLLDIQQYLTTDLNTSSVEKAKPTIAKARQDGRALNVKLNQIVAHMNELTAEMNPSGKVPEK